MPNTSVGATPLARQFFAGSYAAIAHAGPRAEREEDVAFVVGALAFLGRIEEAETWFDGWRLRTAGVEPRTAAAGQFFLGVAHARAGNVERARALLVDRVRERMRVGDGWCVTFVHQGLAAFRYFTGHYKLAARHALRALRAAHSASFAYGKMLATDLRGHALIQVGRFHAGIALLERARGHAVELGFGMNAFAIEVSIASYTSRFVVGDAPMHRIEALLETKAHDSYSRHALLLDLVVAYGRHGRRADAEAALAEAERHALTLDGRRAKVATLLARLDLTRWSGTRAECRELLEQARALVADSDRQFRAMLLGFEAHVGDPPARARALDALDTLVRAHDLHLAKAAIEQWGTSMPLRPFPEDQWSPLLRAVVRRDERVLPRLLALGLHGMVPSLLGHEPGRRLVILGSENALLVEDRGEVALRLNPPRWTPTLLRLLSSGDVSKENIVATLWGLRYRPERHDPLIRTTIHRLRAVLGARSEWIQVTPRGYGLVVPVIEHAPEVHEDPTPFPEDDDMLFDVAAKTMPPPAGVAPASTVRDPVVAAVRDLGSASIRKVARALGVSQSTALRSLREAVARGLVVREGYARATRYRIA